MSPARLTLEGTILTHHLLSKHQRLDAVVTIRR